MAIDKQVLLRIENLEKKLENLQDQVMAEKNLEFLKHHINCSPFPTFTHLKNEYTEIEKKLDKVNREPVPTSIFNHMQTQGIMPSQDHYDGYMPRLDKYIGGICVEPDDGNVKFYLISNECHIGFEESYPNSNRSLHKGDFSITIRPLVTDDGEYKSCSLRIYRLTSGTIFSKNSNNDHLHVQEQFREIKDLIDLMFKGNPTSENVYEECTNVFKWLYITLNKNSTATLELRDEVFENNIVRPTNLIKQIEVDCELDVEVIEK